MIHWILVTTLLLQRAIASILSRLSSVVVLSPHWCYKFYSSMHGTCVSRIKPGQSPECGISEKVLSVTSEVSQQHPEILDFSQVLLLLDWIFLQISVPKYFVWPGASTVARLLWKIEMALTPPKSVVGDLTQREELMLRDANCFNFLSANIIAIGKWKVMVLLSNSLVLKILSFSPNLLLLYGYCIWDF